MLRDIWNRLVQSRRQAAIDREIEKEQMSPEERRFAEESIEDMQADEFAREHLGGVDPDRLLGDGPRREDEPPQG